MKMDDINPFSEHDKTDKQPDTGETILLTWRGMIREKCTWEPKRKHRTSFGEGISLRTKVLRECIEGLYQKLSERMAKPQMHSISMIS